jgi:hypothetical protein
MNLIMIMQLIKQQTLQWRPAALRRVAVAASHLVLPGFLQPCWYHSAELRSSLTSASSPQHKHLLLLWLGL